MERGTGRIRVAIRAAIPALLVAAACAGPREAAPLAGVPPARPAAVESARDAGSQPLVTSTAECASDSDCQLRSGPPRSCTYPCGGCPHAAARSRPPEVYPDKVGDVDCPEKSQVTCSPCPGPRGNPEAACEGGRCVLR